jgi:DNA-binding transcriptional ArsR family regulator
MNEETAVVALESLGNATRLRIFRALVRAGPAGLPVGQLKEKLRIPGSTLSHHLSSLAAAGLMAQTREGRTLRCTANFDAMRGLVAYLVEECCADDGGKC